ncbi:MAG: AMP-binding protein, partial [Sciscionella sp.]
MTRHFGIGDLVARSAARVPGKIALVFGELRQTYTELDESINRTANALRALGVAQRDRVAILSRNHYAFVVLHFALARLGAVSVPMNFMLTAREAAYILGDAGAKGFVAEDHLLPVAIEAADLVSEPPPVRGVIGTQLAGKVPTLWQDVSEWMRYPEAMPPVVPIDDDAPIQLMYTSGTESNPKGAVLTSRSLLAQYTSCIADGAMDADDIELHA